MKIRSAVLELGKFIGGGPLLFTEYIREREAVSYNKTIDALFFG